MFKATNKSKILNFIQFVVHIFEYQRSASPLTKCT